MQLLAVFAVNVKGVTGQARIDPGENEITVRLRILGDLALEGTIITKVAVFAKKLCGFITMFVQRVRGGGIWMVV